MSRESPVLTFDAFVTRGAFSARYRGELGAFTSIHGPSGSGKTTLLDTIAGLVASVGSCSLDGTALHALPAHRRGIGYAFQDDRLFPHLTVKQNLLFSGHVVRFDDVVAALELEPLLSRKPKDLSGGERKRVAIGRAMLAADRLLLLDEPLAPLDAELRTKTAGLIQRLAQALPVLLVSHEPIEAPTVQIERLMTQDSRLTTV